MFLITGPGRSGTQYIAAALRLCGLDVGHERYGRDGIVSGFYCFEAKSYPGAHPKKRPRFDVILHQVREPLQTIASVQTGKSRVWAQQFMDVEPSAGPLRWACHYWLTWNREAERIAEYTYRIEDLKNVWDELQARLGFNAPYSHIAHLPRNLHSRPHERVTWADVKRAAPEVYADLREMATRYGYEVKNG